MNIGEKFYCSRCLEELLEETDCPFCGYRIGEQVWESALEEGTLIGNSRYQIGAVVRQERNYILYGGWNLQRNCPVFIKEFFPIEIVERNGDEVVSKRNRKEDVFDEQYLFSYGALRIPIRIGKRGDGRVCDYIVENKTNYIAITEDTETKKKNDKTSKNNNYCENL